MSEREARVWLSLRLGSEPLVSGDRRQYLTPRDVIAAALERLANVRAKQREGWGKSLARSPRTPVGVLHTHREQFGSKCRRVSTTQGENAADERQSHEHRAQSSEAAASARASVRGSGRVVG